MEGGLGDLDGCYVEHGCIDEEVVLGRARRHLARTPTPTPTPTLPDLSSMEEPGARQA
jgi:hypothetical protein